MNREIVVVAVNADVPEEVVEEDEEKRETVVAEDDEEKGVTGGADKGTVVDDVVEEDVETWEIGVDDEMDDGANKVIVAGENAGKECDEEDYE